MIAQDAMTDIPERLDWCRERVAYFEARLARMEAIPDPSSKPFLQSQLDACRVSLGFWRDLLRGCESRLAPTDGSAPSAPVGPQGPAMDGRIGEGSRQDAGCPALGLVSFRHK